ncbi:MAG: hypothetical protein ACREHV_10530 [Rhizomicrobium sp.]
MRIDLIAESADRLGDIRFEWAVVLRAGEFWLVDFSGFGKGQKPLEEASTFRLCARKVDVARVERYEYLAPDVRRESGRFAGSV